jgi:hypothetical protein
MPAQMALVFTIWSHDRGDTDWVVAHEVGDRGKSAKVMTGAARGIAVGDLASAQGHRGSTAVGARCHVGRRGSGVGSGSCCKEGMCIGLGTGLVHVLWHPWNGEWTPYLNCSYLL